MHADGMPADHVKIAVAFINAVHEAATRGDDYTTVSSVLLQPALNQPWSGHLKLDDAEDWGLMCHSGQTARV